MDELPRMLWAYWITLITAIDWTPFVMTYGTEAVLLAEIGIPTHWVMYYNKQENDEGLSANLDLLEMGLDEVQLRVVVYQKAAARGYNRKVKVRCFQVGNLVLKKKLINVGVFEPKWEGPFRVNEVVTSGSYRLEDLDGRVLPHTWDADPLESVISNSRLNLCNRKLFVKGANYLKKTAHLVHCTF